MLFLALLLPMASLLPLGWLWLWQHGYALYWLAAAFGIAAIVYVVQSFALRKAFPPGTEPVLIEEAEPLAPDSGWTKREQAAWAAVEAVAADVRPAELTDRDKVLNLGLRTIEAVARQIHPGDNNPLWKFTIPEALALIERVSADLRPFVTDSIPLGDQLTVGQVMRIYRWRCAIGVAERAYDIWRLVRLINPVTAAAQEAREQITKRLYASVRDQLARRLAQGYVREVGRAAIDLYGGRLKVSAAELAGHVSASTLRDRGAARAEPLRILVAGRSDSGKSSLVNALAKDVRAIVDAPQDTTEEFQAHEVELAGLDNALVVDSPGLGAGSKQQRQFLAKASESDLILWTVDATKPGDAVDREAIAGIRAHFADRPNRHQPPIVVALTHIDALQPAWPLPNQSLGSDRERVIGEAVAAAARELDMAPADVVPVSVAAGREPYNVEKLAERIAASVPEAQRAQLLRLMEDAAPRLSVKRFWKQAANAAWSAARSVTPTVLKR